MGADTCPSGTSVISTSEECAGAAKSLGLIPFDSAVNGTDAGLSYQEVKGTSSTSPHPGCSYAFDRAEGSNLANEKIINFNSNLSPLADLDPAAQPLCRCKTPATDSPVAPPTGSSPLAPTGTSAKKKNEWAVIVIVVVLCIAGIVFGVWWYRKPNANQSGNPDTKFLML